MYPIYKIKGVKMTKVISRDPNDFNVPGVLVEITAAEAEAMGVTPELAMSEADAMEANEDALIA